MSTIFRKVYFSLIGLFLALPLIVVAGVSVNAKQTLAFPPQGFSTSWYGEIFLNPEWRSALVASVTLALLFRRTCGRDRAAACLVPVAARRAMGEHLPASGVAPFTLPPVITALGLLTFWATAGFYGQPWTAVVSHAIFFVTLPLSRCLSASPRSIGRWSRRPRRWAQMTARSSALSFCR